MEFPARREQNRRRSFLIDDARIAAVPFAHHVDAAAAEAGARRRRSRGRRFVRETKRVAAERRACKFPNHFRFPFRRPILSSRLW